MPTSLLLFLFSLRGVRFLNLPRPPKPLLLPPLLLQPSPHVMVLCSARGRDGHGRRELRIVHHRFLLLLLLVLFLGTALYSAALPSLLLMVLGSVMVPLPQPDAARDGRAWEPRSGLSDNSDSGSGAIGIVLLLCGGGGGGAARPQHADVEEGQKGQLLRDLIWWGCAWGCGTMRRLGVEQYFPSSLVLLVP